MPPIKSILIYLSKDGMERAIALGSRFNQFDEPFVGQDLITMGVLVNRLDELSHALGVNLCGGNS